MWNYDPSRINVADGGRHCHVSSSDGSSNVERFFLGWDGALYCSTHKLNVYLISEDSWAYPISSDTASSTIQDFLGLFETSISKSTFGDYRNKHWKTGDYDVVKFNTKGSTTNNAMLMKHKTDGTYFLWNCSDGEVLHTHTRPSEQRYAFIYCAESSFTDCYSNPTLKKSGDSCSSILGFDMFYNKGADTQAGWAPSVIVDNLCTHYGRYTITVADCKRSNGLDYQSTTWDYPGDYTFKGWDTSPTMSNSYYKDDPSFNVVQFTCKCTSI